MSTTSPTTIPKIDTSQIASSPMTERSPSAASSQKVQFNNNNNNNAALYETPQLTPRHGIWKSDKDLADARRLIPYLAVMLLLPLSASNIYFSLYYFDDVSTQRSEALWHLGYFVIFGALFAFIGKNLIGEFMIVTVFSVGVFNEVFDVGMNKAAYSAVMHGVTWIIVAALLGAISGTFCKVKDILDGRYTKDYSFTTRLYLMLPYVCGIWVGHILVAGWSGFVTVFASIFFLEAVVGYGVFALKLVKHQAAGLEGNNGDLLGVFRALANASFGKVFFGGIIFSIIFFYLLAPSWTTLSLRLPHTVLSAVCIITEVAVYDMVD
jgi:hypothetical protein